MDVKHKGLELRALRHRLSGKGKGDADKEVRTLLDGNGIITTTKEFTHDLDSRKARFNPLRIYVDSIPVTRQKGTHTVEDENNRMNELREFEDEDVDINEHDIKFDRVRYNATPKGSFTAIHGNINEDSAYDLMQLFKQNHAEKVVWTENKAIVNTIKRELTPKTLTGFEALSDSLNDDFSPTVQQEMIVITNQDGYKQLKRVDESGKRKPYLTIQGGNRPLRYFDGYHLEVQSNDILPNENGSAPFIYGSLKRSVKLFEYGTTEILLIKYPFGMSKMISFFRGVENFDVQFMPKSTNTIYGLIPIQ